MGALDSEYIITVFLFEGGRRAQANQSAKFKNEDRNVSFIRTVNF